MSEKKYLLTKDDMCAIYYDGFEQSQNIHNKDLFYKNNRLENDEWLKAHEYHEPTQHTHCCPCGARRVGSIVVDHGSPWKWRDRVLMKVINDNVVRYGDVAFVRERTCQNIGDREGTNGEYYDFKCSACGFECDATDPNFCPECGARVKG